MSNKNNKWRPPVRTPKLEKFLRKLLGLGFDVDDEEQISVKPACSGSWVLLAGLAALKECNKEAIWWHPAESYQYCEKHLSRSDEAFLRQQWRLTRYLIIYRNLIETNFLKDFCNDA